ncbi:hypothetical protein C8F04DRAFT_1278203 [Mycena alexandri]|uniref:Uncharacterized protein n=1 Tax=Mycena alexandri TaxID=1745969 RepID=A0AAD6RZY2_9AGAR|nr:hypothetical protein C8F04DRAFT_1278203 [Mycena alexandri]
MPAHKTRAKLAVIVNDHQTGNDQLIEGRANRYQDGPGENYIVLRQLWVDYIQWKAGTITTTELRSRTEVKFGQSGNVKQRRTQYRKCGGKYRLVWYASYTTPERGDYTYFSAWVGLHRVDWIKLEVIHKAFSWTIIGRRVTPESCSPRAFPVLNYRYRFQLESGEGIRPANRRGLDFDVVNVINQNPPADNYLPQFPNVLYVAALVGPDNYYPSATRVE